MGWNKSSRAALAALPARVAGLMSAGLALALVGLAPLPALAAKPEPWQYNFQAAATPVMERLESFHDLLLVIIIAIAVFVLVLLLYVMFRFREGANPNPSRTSHNTVIEILWTVIPVLILVVIAVPSFRILYYEDKAPNAEMTIKVTGHQWYWSYEYPDNGNFTFDSNLVQDADLKDGQIRLLSVDNPLVVPVGTQIRVLTTSTDVIHSWFMPSFGLQKYAMPGRTNETWFQAEKEGVYYGQCNQICGFYHAYMPIEIHVLSKDDFAKWAAEAKTKFAKVDAPAPALAQATLN
jgi:cytochrome c oxidase subunit 2